MEDPRDFERGTLVPDPGILRERGESGVELGLNSIGDFDTGPLVQIAPDLKDVFVRLRRDDVTHEDGRGRLSQSAFFS